MKPSFDGKLITRSSGIYFFSVFFLFESIFHDFSSDFMPRTSGKPRFQPGAGNWHRSEPEPVEPERETEPVEPEPVEPEPAGYY